MTNANKFNLLLDVVKLMHSLADGLEAVAYAFADSQEIFVDAKEVSKPVETGQPTKQIAAEKHLLWQMSVPCLRLKRRTE